MYKTRWFSPITWPVLSFAVVIFFGSIVLSMPFSWAEGQSLSYIDALFLSTSAVCVTGLASVDVGTVLSGAGLTILLLLIQLGGLGITTYTSLVFILWRNRVPFSDRLAVHQALLNKDILDVRTFIWQVVLLVIGVEGAAAILLYLHDPVLFHPFSAVFHAISAFCNAGFSLYADNLMRFQGDTAVNVIIGASIILGGLGFAVLHEIIRVFYAYVCNAFRRLGFCAQCASPLSYDHISKNPVRPLNIDRYSRLVLVTSFWFVVVGALFLMLLEWPHAQEGEGAGTGWTLILTSFFHSISARTAGFVTMDLALLSDASILVIVALMFIGGAPGSCAGGVKITTFRVLVGFMRTQVSGEKDVLVRDRAIPDETVRQALTLFFFGALTVALSVILLCVSENIFRIHESHTPLLPLLLETVSAFGTVGLSMNLTPHLSDVGKIIIMLNMFIGRVGFISLLTALQSLRPSRKYFYPTTRMPIG